MALTGLKVVEFAGLAPVPFTGLVLADHGASVTRIDRPGSASHDRLCRGKRSVAINTKRPDGLEIAKQLISEADVLIDPFRPGVMERMGLGPDVFLGSSGLNPKLVYARITGFPKTGLQRDMAGHDINYLAQSGVLSMMPGTTSPSFPMNLLADFAGGGLLCATGILLALLQRNKSGLGQVVEVDMVSGTRYLASYPLLNAENTPLFTQPKDGNAFQHPRNTGLLNGGAPFYGVYTCSDGRHFSVGCLEPQFFRVFLEIFMKALPSLKGKEAWQPSLETQSRPKEWPKLRDYLTQGFLMKTQAEWTKLYQGTDACAVPVLTPGEASHAYSGVVPIPHPWFEPEPPKILEPARPLEPGTHTLELLAEAGVSAEETEKLLRSGVVNAPSRTKVNAKL